MNQDSIKTDTKKSNIQIKKQTDQFSLLWPDPLNREESSTFKLDEEIRKDLELDKLFRVLCTSERQLLEVSPVLKQISCDPAVITYRQDVFEDLTAYPALAQCFEKILPYLDALKLQQRGEKKEQVDLFRITARLGELESYIICIRQLHKAFSSIGGYLQSAAFRKLRGIVASVNSDPLFARLREELPALITRIRGIRSVTIGVNLDKNLLPFEATLIAVNKEIYTEKSLNLLSRLTGDTTAGKWQSIARLHRAPSKGLETQKGRVNLDSDTYGYAVNPLMVPLFKDLNDVIRKISTPVARALKGFITINTAFLGNLKQELIFYIGGLGMIKALQSAGLPVCRPEIRDTNERICLIQGMYNINLALNFIKKEKKPAGELIIGNDVNLTQDGRIAVITGPNRGGKTTYTQGVGLCQILMQLGLPVTAEKAVISPVDGIYTHFPIEEKIDRGTGRLGDEARRFSEIFSVLTRHSLLLLNESLSSTGAAESLYIVSDVVQVIGELGTRTVFATHLHELAASIDEINSRLSGNEKIINLVAVAVEEKQSHKIKRTFKIVPGPPAGHSYAREVAENFGVSYAQLTAKLHQRGVL